LRNAAPDCRDTFHDKVDILRSRFDEHFLLPPDSAKTARLVREGYEELERRRDPDPYLTPFMPGGTMFMRNPPPPLESLYPEGIPEGVSRRRVNIDFSNIPDDQPYADRVFVDSISKDYWIDK
jgi:NADH dehydrogenase (ubiquinone) 1 beta subcomplex subunit 9